MVHGIFIFQNPIKEKTFKVDKSWISLALKMHKNTLITTVKTVFKSDLQFLSYIQKTAKNIQNIVKWQNVEPFWP